MKDLSAAIRPWLLLILATIITLPSSAQDNSPPFTRADTLRGSITPQRAWWEVTFYDLNVNIQPEDSTINGYNEITYSVTGDPQKMQIDLQDPLRIEKVKQNGKELSFHRVDSSYAYFIDMPKNLEKGSYYTVTVYYHGHPKVAARPPWDGGFVWARDSKGAPWVATANQGLGASVWWPNKDHQSAEPDSMSINITVPDPMVEVSNGRLRSKTPHNDGTTTWSWFVTNPINNYNVAINAGNFVNFTDTYSGLKGELDLSFWALEDHLDEAKKQFRQAKPMLQCFEKWFGPYPFYNDGYKLVETPYLGMEHQSAVGYGNGFENGYEGVDLSGTGWGLKWDFIIVHESAHEWWGNSITTEDIADMWVHESFASYAESIYTECQFGKEAGAEYTIGLRQRIKNNRPIIGPYGVNKEGSGDMYYKGNNMVHTIRHIINDDAAFKSILHGLQKDFFHQTVTTEQVENYINNRTDYDLGPVFDQYLRHAEIPIFQYKLYGDTLKYRWKAKVENFDMPIRVLVSKDKYVRLQPTVKEWKTTTVDLSNPDNFKVDNNFYVYTEQIQ